MEQSQAMTAIRGAAKSIKIDKDLPSWLVDLSTKAMEGLSGIQGIDEKDYVPKSIICQKYSAGWFDSDYSKILIRYPSFHTRPHIIILPANTTAPWFRDALIGRICLLREKVWGSGACALYCGIKHMKFCDTFRHAGVIAINRYVSY